MVLKQQITHSWHYLVRKLHRHVTVTVLVLKMNELFTSSSELHMRPRKRAFSRAFSLRGVLLSAYVFDGRATT